MTDFVQVPRETLQAAVEALVYCEALNSSVQQQKVQAVTKLRALLDAPKVERKPLSDEGVWKIWHSMERDGAHAVITFARAIEAAHGIKEQA